MTAIETAGVEVHAELLDAIASFPVARTVHHCGRPFGVSPFAVYAVCPDCTGRQEFEGQPETLMCGRCRRASKVDWTTTY